MGTFSQEEAVHERQERLLTMLERLLELPMMAINATLNLAVYQAVRVLAADLVNIFFYDPANETLVASDASETPMRKRQQAIGMDRLPIANGGRVVEVFLSGISFLTGRADQDPTELMGVKVGLAVQSQIATVFKVRTQHRGVLLAASGTPDFFSTLDLRFLESFARWVGIVLGRMELVERMSYETMDLRRLLPIEELLTIMTHDLRNYLMPLKGRLDLLEERARRDGREKDVRDAEACNHTLDLLGRVISDLLDVNRLNQGLFAINPQPMDLVALVQKGVATFNSVEFPISVQAPAEVILSADPDRLRQVLENLLVYAVNHAPTEAPINVDVRLERQMSGPWVFIIVSYTNTALPPEQLTRFFHPFVSGSQSTGQGLGFYLSNQIAQAHYGMLTADVEEGKGVRFTFAFPVEEEELIVREKNKP